MTQENFIQLPVDGKGKKTRTLTKEVNSIEVHQQLIGVADFQGVEVDFATSANQTSMINVLNNIADEIGAEVVTQKINIFGEELIASGSTLTVASYNIPTGKKFKFTGAIIGGEEAGEFLFQKNTTTFSLARNSGSNRTLTIKFIEPVECEEGDVVAVLAKNKGDKQRQFEVTLSGSLTDE